MPKSLDDLGAEYRAAVTARDSAKDRYRSAEEELEAAGDEYREESKAADRTMKALLDAALEKQEK